MSSKVPSQAELEANRAALEKRNANLEKLKAKALSNGSTNTANEYQRMIDENSVKINNYGANINNYTNYFKAETEQANYEKWVEGGSSGTVANPIPSSIKAQTTTTVTEVSTDSGGGSYTVSRAKDTPNATSQGLQSKADTLKAQSELYLVDPNTAAGQKLLQQSVSNGTITQAQLNEIKSLSPDQRFDKASEIANQGIATESQAQAAMTRGQTSVDYQPSTTTTRVSTVTTDAANISPTITGAVPEAGITTVQNGNATVQVVNNNNGTSSYTLPSGSSVTIDNRPIESTNTTVTEPTSPPPAVAPTQESASDIAAQYRAQVADAQSNKRYYEAQLAEITIKEKQYANSIRKVDEELNNPNTDPLLKAQLLKERAGYENNLQKLAIQSSNAEQSINSANDQIYINTEAAESAETAAVAGLGVDNPVPQPPTADPAVAAQANLATLTPEQAAFLDANGNIATEPDTISEADDAAAAIADAEARAAADEAAYVIKEPPDIIGVDYISNAVADAERRDAEANAEREAEGFTPTSAGANTAIAAQPNTDQFVGDSKNNNQSPAVQFNKAVDWRVRISLAPSAPYFYNIAGQTDILYPLKATNGVVFPYTPTVSLSYVASYEATDPTHSNYKIFSYRGSSVSDISITADFTAQNVAEATYLRAVIHFFRSASKMFYGLDQSPKAGIPPPLLYLSGFGEYQFDNHPMVLSQFQYTLPNDVDYIMAGDIVQTLIQGNQQLNAPASSTNVFTTQINRLVANKLQKGGQNTPPLFRTTSTGETTRIPTKMSMTLSFHPMITRRMISDKFSLKDYATGKLLNGSKNAGYGGGVW